MTGNAGDYYAAPDYQPALQQGDIVLAPIVRLETTDNRLGRWDILDETRITIPATQPELSPYIVKAGYAVAMLTTHDCHLDREFLRSYESLRSTQMPKERALATAESDPNLDRFLTLSPLLPLDRFHFSREALFRHEVIGYFPVVANDEVGIQESAVDLMYRSTVERHLIVRRLAVLGEVSRTDLRYSLARLDALRTPAIGFELENAVGSRIRAVRTGARTGSIVIELNNGDELQLLLQPTSVEHRGPERKEAPRSI